jgi:hypothetical protein
MSVIPLKGKKPAFSWDHLTTAAASRAQIQYWDQTGILQNVGVICGAVSRNLSVIDCDGIEAVRLFAETFPALRQTRVVVTGSRQGAHFYFYVQFPPENTWVTGRNGGNIEIRASKCYVVAPPSIHPVSRLAYIVGRDLPIMRVNNLQNVEDWLKLLRSEMSSSAASHPSGTDGHTSNAIRNSTKYGMAALASEMANIRRTREGGQNNALYRAALKLGSLIADHALDRHIVESSLMDVASEIGYVKRDGAGAAWKTICSGINSGVRSSRDTYKQR